MVMLPILSPSPAHAATSWSGAVAITTTLCNGEFMAVDTHRATTFEYRQVATLVNGRVYEVGNVEVMRSGYFSGHRSWHPVPWGHVSVWVWYGDDLGNGRVAWGGEWVRTTGGGWYCYR